MSKIAFVVDGFNLYHSIKSAGKSLRLGKRGTKWLSLDSLFRSYWANIGNEVGRVTKTTPLIFTSHEVYYFSALALHMDAPDPDTSVRQQSYFDCLTESGVNVQVSRFKRKEITCPRCKTIFDRYEEKETDVAISLKIVQLAIEKDAEVIVVVSGDTDIAPAIRAARLFNPTVRIVCLFPFDRLNYELVRLSDATITMTAQAYTRHQFVDPYTLIDGSKVAKPPRW